jgi:hypothetical protein
MSGNFSCISGVLNFLLKPFAFEEVYPNENFEIYIMKRLLALICLVLFVGVLSSCSSGSKACAAYAKHDTDKQPSLSDVQ